MHTTFVMKAEELDEKVLKGIKTSYKDKQIEITVRELDETEYLMKNDANRKRLMKAVRNVKERKNLVEVNSHLLKKVK